MKTLQKQRQLYDLGYYGAGPEELDGLWGIKSRAATLEYQHDAGLEADGIFGAHTAARTKEEISALQRLLGVEPDGLVGPVTLSATADFQRLRGLPATGRMDDATRETLEEPRPSSSPHRRKLSRSSSAMPLSFVPIHSRSLLSTCRQTTLATPDVESIRSKVLPS